MLEETGRALPRTRYGKISRVEINEERRGQGRGDGRLYFTVSVPRGPLYITLAPLTKGSWWDGSIQDRIIWVVICRRRCWFFDSVCWLVRVRPPAARTRSLRGPIPPPPPVFPSSLPSLLRCPLSPRFPSLFALYLRPSLGRRPTALRERSEC